MIMDRIVELYDLRFVYDTLLYAFGSSYDIPIKKFISDIDVGVIIQYFENLSISNEPEDKELTKEVEELSNFLDTILNLLTYEPTLEEIREFIKEKGMDTNIEIEIRNINVKLSELERIKTELSAKYTPLIEKIEQKMRQQLEYYKYFVQMAGLLNGCKEAYEVLHSVEQPKTQFHLH